jgi:hypothetical protein
MNLEAHKAFLAQKKPMSRLQRRQIFYLLNKCGGIGVCNGVAKQLKIVYNASIPEYKNHISPDFKEISYAFNAYGLKNEFNKALSKSVGKKLRIMLIYLGKEIDLGIYEHVKTTKTHAVLERVDDTSFYEAKNVRELMKSCNEKTWYMFWQEKNKGKIKYEPFMCTVPNQRDYLLDFGVEQILVETKFEDELSDETLYRCQIAAQKSKQTVAVINGSPYNIKEFVVFNKFGKRVNSKNIFYRQIKRTLFDA